MTNKPNDKKTMTYEKVVAIFGDLVAKFIGSQLSELRQRVEALEAIVKPAWYGRVIHETKCATDFTFGMRVVSKKGVRGIVSASDYANDVVRLVDESGKSLGFFPAADLQEQPSDGCGCTIIQAQSNGSTESRCGSLEKQTADDAALKPAPLAIGLNASGQRCWMMPTARGYEYIPLDSVEGIELSNQWKQPADDSAKVIEDETKESK